MANISERIIYVFNKHGNAIAQLTAQDGITNSEIELRMNDINIFSFTIVGENPKIKDINKIDNRFIADGREFILISEDSVSIERDENGTITTTFTLPESVKLLDKRYIQAYNDTQGFDHMDKHMVVLLSKGTSQLKVNDTNINNPYEKGTAGYVLYALLHGTGWSIDEVDVEGKYDLETDKKTILENIKEVVNTWGGLLVIDSLNKFISLRDEEKYMPYNPMKIEYEKNQKSIRRRVNNDIATKIYVYGDSNLNIASVNNGKEYLEDYSYTDTVYEAIIYNTDITDATELKEWGEKQLELMCKPTYSYEVSAIDLRTLPEYKNNTSNGFKLYDVIDIVDIVDSAITDSLYERRRIISYKYDFMQPHICDLEVGDALKNFTGKLKETFKAQQIVSDTFNSFKQMSGTILKQGTTPEINLINSHMSSLTQTVTDFTFAFETIGIDGFTQKGKTKISQNGIDIFQGAITIYKGLTTGTEKLFYTDSGGNLVISGIIEAIGGSIGGFEISRNAIRSIWDTNMSSGMQVGTSGAWSFWAGADSLTNYSNAPFRVSHVGKLYAMSAEIGGFTTDSGHIYSSRVAEDIFGDEREVFTTMKRGGFVFLACGSPKFNDTSDSAFQIYHNGEIRSTTQWCQTRLVSKKTNGAWGQGGGVTGLEFHTNGGEGATGYQRVGYLSVNHDYHDGVTRTWMELNGRNTDEVFIDGYQMDITARRLSISGSERTYIGGGSVSIGGYPPLCGEVLWSGSLTLPPLSSYKPTLTMSESVSNYDFLAIEYNWGSGNRTDIVAVASGTHYLTSTNIVDDPSSDSTYHQITEIGFTRSGDTLTFTVGSLVQIPNGSYAPTRNNNPGFVITKITGIKLN